MDISIPKILFRNHASFQVNLGDNTLLCDPWFSGSVFNESWTLLKETNSEMSGLNANLFIWISHEHPDHLHFPTLREIRKNHPGDIHVYYRKQENKNVKEAIEKIGFVFHEIESEKITNICDSISICSFSEGPDTAAIILAGDKVILNQNDCILDRKKSLKIKRLFKKIDVWFFQFSLAGYYGNEDDKDRLVAAREKHLDLIRYYFDIFRPAIYIPFASFIYFSKAGNKYLNDYRVSPKEACHSINPERAQLLWYGDEVDWSGQSLRRNEDNSRKWESIWNPQELRIELKVGNADIEAEAKSFVNKLHTKFPKFLLPGEIIIKLRESGRILKLNPREGSTTFLASETSYIVAEVGDSDLVFFFKFPWGADTLNITGNLKIVSQFKWRWLAYLKHCSYVMQTRHVLVQGIVALVGAALRSFQYKMKY